MDLFALANPRFEVDNVKSQSTCIQLETKVAGGNVLGTLVVQRLGGCAEILGRFVDRVQASDAVLSSEGRHRLLVGCTSRECESYLGMQPGEK